MKLDRSTYHRDQLLVAKSYGLENMV